MSAALFPTKESVLAELEVGSDEWLATPEAVAIMGDVRAAHGVIEAQRLAMSMAWAAGYLAGTQALVHKANALAKAKNQ